MTTALQIIDRAYSLLGSKSAGDPISGDDADYALGALNSLIDSWNTQRIFVVSVADVIGTVSATSATVGPGLTFDTPRPVRIEGGVFARVGGIDYPIEQIDRDQYDAISLKTVTATFPQYFYYDALMPTANVYFYPVPSAPVVVYLSVQTQLTEFADTGTSYSLAPGYRRALEYSLAEELAPGIRPLDPFIVRQAAASRKAIMRTNLEVPKLEVVTTGGRFSIYSGL